MEYVSQSLNPNEEVIRIGQFHWLYTFSAITWVVMGVVGMCAVLYAGYYWEISRAVASEFQGLPESLKSQAWNEIVARKGGMLSVMKGLHVGIKVLAIVSLVFGLFSFAQMMIVKAYTEICITTERLILKQGVLSVNSDELNVDRIEGVNVTQGIIGRWLNYGNVIVRGLGIGEVRLPPMVDPIGFRRAIDQAKAIDD